MFSSLWLWCCSWQCVVMVTDDVYVAMATARMSAGRPRRCSAIDYSPVPCTERADVDDTAASPSSRLQSLGDISLSVTVPSPSLARRLPARHRAASSSADTVLQKDQDSLTASASDVLSAAGNERLNRYRDRMSSVRVLFQTKIYNFLERPTGWLCFLYHFCVYVYFAVVT